mgnify:CR=1 FL=1|tara:strand:+ start:605 stop:895 length:291 start_codon:yes stop_codon:yes gene_type:complete
MNYSKIPQNLPIELVIKIMSFIDMTTPSARAFKESEMREIKTIELLSVNPLIEGTLTLIGYGNEALNQEWDEFENGSDSYWEGFYAAHGLSADGFI